MTMPILGHLQASTRVEAALDSSIRIRSLGRDRWIDYSRASQALLKLEHLLETPPKERMPCMVLHGDSNIGKTLIVAKFQREHPDNFDDVKGVERRDVVVMQMPATPDQHRFYTALLFVLGAPHSASATLSVLERLARELLRRIKPRMLVVDEVHHLLAGNHREQRASLNLLKFLANDLKFSIVLVGTADAPLALATDPQMISRFTPFQVPRWRESDDLRRLLGAFERVLPLRKPSDLMQRSIAQFVLSASEGLTGEISRLLNEAAALAIIDGTEHITLEHLKHVAVLTAEIRPLPVAPRPFGAEVLGGGIGRLAARYRMTVKEFAERHGLDLNIEDRGGWLTMPALEDQAADVLAALTRISREQIMLIHAPLPSTSKRTRFCYCARCVFLNPLNVAAPIWRWEWLDETLSACPVHDAEFTTLPSGRVLACGNLTHLMQLVSRNDRYLRCGTYCSRASVVRCAAGGVC